MMSGTSQEFLMSRDITTLMVNQEKYGGKLYSKAILLYEPHRKYALGHYKQQYEKQKSLFRGYSGITFAIYDFTIGRIMIFHTTSLQSDTNRHFCVVGIIFFFFNIFLFLYTVGIISFHITCIFILRIRRAC